MNTGFEKLFVKRGHPSDNVIDGELINVVTCYIKIQMAELFNIFSFCNLEKKDLVELVLQHSQVSSPLDATDSQSSRLSSSESYTDNGIRVSDQVRDDHLTIYVITYVMNYLIRRFHWSVTETFLRITLNLVIEGNGSRRNLEIKERTGLKPNRPPRPRWRGWRQLGRLSRRRLLQ